MMGERRESLKSGVPGESQRKRANGGAKIPQVFARHLRALGIVETGIEGHQTTHG